MYIYFLKKRSEPSYDITFLALESIQNHIRKKKIIYITRGLKNAGIMRRVCDDKGECNYTIKGRGPLKETKHTVLSLCIQKKTTIYVYLYVHTKFESIFTAVLLRLTDRAWAPA